MSILKSEPPNVAINSFFSSFLRNATCAVFFFVAFLVKPVFAQHETSVESIGYTVQKSARADESQIRLAQTSAPQRTRIRVGFVDNDDPFSAIDEDGVKSGYAYEYLQYLAYYASWRYEYVYGDFSTLHEKLRNGEIDMLMHVFKIEEDHDNLFYSDYPMGSESVFLFVKPENTSVIQNSLKTIEGKTVAVANNFYGLPFLKNWLRHNNLSCRLVMFDSEQEAISAFENNYVDMLFYSDTHCNLDWIPLSRIAAFDYYIALSPNAKDIYAEFSDAQTKMYQTNPNFNYTIYNSVYSRLYYDRRLSEDENEWLKNHSVIALGCLKDNLPLSGMDSTKKPIGFITDFLQVVKKELGITKGTFYYKFYNSTDDLIAALQKGEIDAAFPITTDIYQAETSTIFISTPILRNIFASTTDDDGEKSKASGLFRDYVSFAATQQNTPFLDMMNRAKNFIPDETIHFILNKYIPKEIVFSLWDFVSENRWYILSFIVLVAFVIVGFSYGDAEKRKKLVARAELAEQKELRDQQEVLFNELVEDFDTIAIIDLDKEIVKRFSLRRKFKVLEKDLERIHSYYNRMNYFAEHAVYKDDVAMYKRAMRKEAILEALEKKSSYVVPVRICFGKEVMYYQAKIVRDTSSKDGNTVILGVRNIDEESKKTIRHNKLLEEAKEKADVANKAKSTFLFNMSHDIRTPMNAIVGFTDMALQYKMNPEKVEDCLKKVQVSSEHLLKLIDDILDMARIENGKIELEETEANLYGIIKDIVAIVQGSAEQKQIRFSLSLENISDSHIIIDTLRFKRIMINILTNAIKYTRSGGYVNFTVKQISAAKKGEGTYEFIVADNGIGMSKDFVRHIYDSFSRERSSSVSGVEGTGLGMSITKGLVEKMGGKISIKTQQRKGTTVFVKLPIKVQDKNATKADNSDDSGEAAVKKELRTEFNGHRALLVEDNELNREIGKTILEQKGLDVDLAVDGVDALDKAREAEPGYYDIIFMDIQMPLMTGYTATRMIRQVNDSYADIPIIAMTANAFEEDRKKALEAGMDGHLTKPIKLDALLSVLNEFLD